MENLKTIIKLTKRQFAFSYHHEPVIRALSVIKHPSHHWVDKCHTPTHSPCASLIKAFVQGPAVKLSGNCKDKGQWLACKGDIHLAGERTLRPQSPGRTVRLLQIRPSPVPGRSRPGATSAHCAGFSLLRAEPASHPPVTAGTPHPHLTQTEGTSLPHRHCGAWPHSSPRAEPSPSLLCAHASDT